MKRDYLIYPSMIGSQSGIIWSYNSSNITSTFDSTTPLNISAHQCDNLTICLWYVSPLQSLNDSAETHYALLGEWNKWTAVSQQRFLSITTDTKNNRATIIVQGVPDETIPIVVYHSVLRSMMVNCSFSSDKDQAQIIVTPSNIICS